MASSTRGKNVDFAFLQPECPSTHAAIELSEYISILSKKGYETMWSPTSGQDPMRTASVKYSGTDMPEGWDSLIIDVITRQDHSVIMHSMF